MSQIVWASVDPVRRKVDIYPKAIATRIEKSYTERDPWMPSTCVLGSDFFNATIHFHPSGSKYQTTPGMSMGRAGFKQPGYRSVKRCEVYNGNIIIYAKQVHGEWRITNEIDSELRFEESPLTENIITTDYLDENTTIKPWCKEDLESQSLDSLVVVWQWCQLTCVSVSLCSDNNWIPYNNDNNISIEHAFQSNYTSVRIDLPIIGQRDIRFNPGACYASQVSLDHSRNRSVRRVVKTIQELREMFSRIAKPPENYSEIVNDLPDGEVPHHYCCPILQEIMTDPVKTIDGFTYERSAIERWFEHRVSSPLTGLSLASDTLVSNTELANAIAEFIKRVKESTPSAVAVI